jgi:hypothetical protein
MRKGLRRASESSLCIPLSMLDYPLMAVSKQTRFSYRAQSQTSSITAMWNSRLLSEECFKGQDSEVEYCTKHYTTNTRIYTCSTTVQSMETWKDQGRR